MKFQLESKFKPAGDQPQAIKKLADGYKKFPMQTLLGVTGSGKTFTIASVINKIQKPTLVLSPNKTLAAQLYNEFQAFFPNNKVCYFVSYYDYYQPESYIPQTDTYIEKDAKINDRIERLRIETAANVLMRNDVIVVASVSCIYGFGRPAMFEEYSFKLKPGQTISRDQILGDLIKLQFERNDLELKNGRFRVKGDTIDIVQGTSPNIIRIQLLGDEIETITEIDYFNGNKIKSFNEITIVPANPYLFEESNKGFALDAIREELNKRLPKLGVVEAHRLKQRTEYDLEMIEELGYCNGIENYSRYFDDRQAGQPPYTLLDFFNYNYKNDWLMMIDESHVAIPQLHGMQRGDRSRKKNLIDNGFRLPSAYDNRPLSFDEFEKYMQHVIFTSATPSDYEFNESKQVVEQIIRPTGLVDPGVEVRKTEGQIDDLIAEAKQVIAMGNRVLVTTLTKRMSENLTKYLKEKGLKVDYLHSEIDTLERSKIIADLRRGKFDILVGINLLREGLDIPEVALVAILDADKEGFLRNARSLIQTIGRAARNVNSKVILYADQMTDSMKQAIQETERRRKKQIAYNKKHNIKPKTIIKKINDEIVQEAADEFDWEDIPPQDITNKIAELEEEMHLAAEQLHFERAIELREKLRKIKSFD
jgi:excinuclease ABC subunit B